MAASGELPFRFFEGVGMRLEARSAGRGNQEPPAGNLPGGSCYPWGHDRRTAPALAPPRPRGRLAPGRRGHRPPGGERGRGGRPAGGGNAADAAVAAAFALSVAEPQSSGIGGGGLALVYVAREDRVYAVDFRETAPAAATKDMFLVDGKPDPLRSRCGGLSVAVPGAVKGYAEIARRFGTEAAAGAGRAGGEAGAGRGPGRPRLAGAGRWPRGPACARTSPGRRSSSTAGSRTSPGSGWCRRTWPRP